MSRPNPTDAKNQLAELASNYKTAIPVSALTGKGIDRLLQVIEDSLSANWVAVDVVIPYQQGALTALFHQQGVVEKETHTAAGVRIVGRVPGRLAYRFQQLEE